MFKYCITITLITVLCNLQIHRRTIKCNTFAPCLYKVGNSRKTACIIIDNNLTCNDTSANTIVEYQRNASVKEVLKMLIFPCIFGLRHNYATNLVLLERFAYLNLFLIFLTTLCNKDTVALDGSDLFYPCKYRREIIMDELGYYNTNDLGRHNTTMTQRLCNSIRHKIMFARITLNQFAAFLTNMRTVLQCT